MHEADLERQNPLLKSMSFDLNLNTKNSVGNKMDKRKKKGKDSVGKITVKQRSNSHAQNIYTLIPFWVVYFCQGACC